MSEASDFFNLCEAVGSRTPFWVQGAGGNVSEKIDRAGQKVLRIKASGYRLDQVTEAQGFVDMNYQETRQKLSGLLHKADGEGLYSDLLATGVVARAKSNDRASMETGFHLAIESSLVAHFHSLVGLLLADLYFKGDSWALQFISSMPLSCRFLDYVKPGLDLSLAIQQAGPAEIYFLKNHGVILALKSPAELQQWLQLERSIMETFGWHALLQPIENESTYWPLAALMPDTVVFMDRLLALLEKDPNRLGYFRLQADAPVDASLRELWAANVRVLSTQADVARIPPSEWESISGMPVEKYRQSMQIPLEGL